MVEVINDLDIRGATSQSLINENSLRSEEYNQGITKLESKELSIGNGQSSNIS